MTLAGIDVSQWNQSANWANLTGVSFVVARASIGTRPDMMFKSHMAGAAEVGAIPGAYHYLERGSLVSAAAQCDFFLSIIGDPTGHLIQLDVEGGGGASYQDVVDFVTRWNERTNYHPIFIYAGAPYWTSLGNHNGVRLGPWWLPNYPGGGYPGDGAPQWRESVGGWKHPTIWQYGPFRTPAFLNAVDGNAFLGSRDDLLAYTGAAPLTTFTLLPGPTATVVVNGDGHSYLRLADGTLHSVAAGFTKTHAIPIQLSGSILGTTPDRQIGWLVGDEAAFLLGVDVTATPDPGLASVQAALAASTASLISAASALSKIKEIVNA